jgi:hypothetical protein
MKSAENIDRLVEKFYAARRSSITTTTEMDKRLFDDALRVIEEPRQTRRAVMQPDILRIIMKSRITKLATAAMIILAVVLSITILNRSASSAWAIEQSIEVLGKYKAILVKCLECTFGKNGSLQQRHFKWWAAANEEQTTVKKARMEVDGVPIMTANGEETWQYDLQTNTVHKKRPYGTPECWLGSQFLKQLKDFRDSGVIAGWQVTYGKDHVTDKQRAFLKIAWLEERYNGPRSLWIEFDMQSMLLVSAKQWENANWEGPASAVSS